jgi:DnaK suppressor protein
MPKRITPMLRAQMLEEIEQLRQQIYQYIQQDHQPEFGNRTLKLDQSPLSHWPELLQLWLTPELKIKASRLEALLAAVSLMDMGLYGLCCDCEHRIERELLLQDPARQRCHHCSAKLHER